jgi:hypothetical protein
VNVPSVVYGGIPFLVEVQAKDLDGNKIVESVEISSHAEMVGSTEESGLLQGQTTSIAINGSANFTNLVLNGAGSYSLLFVTVAPLVRVRSSAITVMVGEPAGVRIEWTNRSSFISMEPLSPPPVAWTVDAGGNPTSTNLVFHAELQAQRSNQLRDKKNVSFQGNLFGKTVVQAVGGRANFTDLAISEKLFRYFLVFKVAGVGQAQTDFFTVLPGPASSLYILRQPTNSVAAVVLPSQPIVLIWDDGNNTVDVDSRVNVTIQDHPPMHVRGHSSVLAVSGVANFTGCIFLMLR